MAIKRRKRATTERLASSAQDQIAGKIAVITGASRGIGLEIARALAARRCNLALAARSFHLLSEAARELGKNRIKVLQRPCDVRVESSVEEFFDAASNEFGRVDFLINNAGIAHELASIEKLNPLVWSDVIQTNLDGLFYCTHYALPLMKAGSTIVNNLSVAAQGQFPGHAAYNASKWGGLGFTNTLREELRERRIRVVALIPGPTNTDIWDQFWPDRPRDRMMTAASVAQAVVACLELPPEAVVEEIKLRPIGGTL